MKSRAPNAGRSPCDLRAIRFPGTFFASLGWPTTRFPPPRVMEAERTPSVLFTEVSAPRRRSPPCDMSAFACPPDLPELWRGFRVGPRASDSSPPDFGYSGVRLPETFSGNWRFGVGFFDKISLIYRMSRQAVVSHSGRTRSHQKPACHGGESSNELRHSEKKVVCFSDVLLF